VKPLTFEVVVTPRHTLEHRQGQSFYAFLEKQAPGTVLRMTLEPPSKPIRSLRANSYYWATIVPVLAEHFGYTNMEMHEELKYLFNPVPLKLDPMKVKGGTTTTLKTDEFAEYVKQIQVWGLVEHGVVFRDKEDGEDW